MAPKHAIVKFKSSQAGFAHYVRPSTAAGFGSRLTSFEDSMKVNNALAAGTVSVCRRAFLLGVAAMTVEASVSRSAPNLHQPGQASSSIIVFDVNETLLDFSILTPVFTRIFGDGSMLRTWFNQVVLYSEALTLSGQYVNAGTVGAAVLQMMAEIAGRTVYPSDLDELKRLSAAMPTYADTPAALATLRQAGLRLVTLSNNPSAGVQVQLTGAGLRPFFDELHSIDDRIRRYKPARESYTALATTLGVAPAQLWLVSCHAFDTLGAAAAGYRTALVLRPGNAPISLGTPPDVVGTDLRVIADEILAKINTDGSEHGAGGGIP